MSALNKANTHKTNSQAKQIKRAAISPGSDLSNADLNVERTADVVLSEAQSLKKDSAKRGEKLDITG